MAQKPIGYYGTFTPTGVDPTVAQRMEQLAGVAGQVADMAVGFGKAQASADAPEQALADVAKAREEGTELKKKSPFAWGAEVYNNTLTDAYVGAKELDFSKAVTKIAAENPYDVINFENQIKEYRQSTVSNLQPEFAAEVERKMNVITANASSKIYANQVNRSLEEANALSLDNIETTTNQMLRAASDGDQETAQSLFSDTISMLDKRVKNNQALEGSINSDKQLLESSLKGQYARRILDQTIKNEGVIAASEFILKVDDLPEPSMTVEQQDALVSTLRSDLTRYLNLDDIENNINEKENANKQENNSGVLLDGIINGTTDVADLQLAYATKQINFVDFNNLSKTLNSRGQGFDDFNIVADIQDLIVTDPQAAKTLVMLNANTSLTTATSEKLLASIRNSQTSEAILQQNDVKRFRTFVKNQITPVGLSGSLDQNKLKDQSNLILVFDQRVLEGEDPQIVTKDLMSIIPDIKDERNSKEERIKTLNTQQEKEGMSKDQYNKKYEEIINESDINKNYTSYLAYLKILSGQ